MTTKSKLTTPEIIILIAAATVTLTVVSTCSPLYPFNPWNDINCFFTVGRGITHGMVPYRDLYEQKGPLLYFIYALAALISEKSFTGAWIIECIMASVFAIFSWKTVKLFTEPPKYAVMLMPVLIGITYTLRMFNYGGNAEEINKTPGAKILTYDIMDCGFYTAAGVLPQNRYYCYLSMEKDFPDILEQQDRLIKEGYFDYLVTSYNFDSTTWDNYEEIRKEIDAHVNYFGDRMPEGYKLYKRK